MLMMKCPKCSEHIRSALLAEIKEIRCNHCKEKVPVAGILVSSHGFTFERSDLLKRFYRYRKLLDEVIEERNSMTGNQSTTDESLRSIEKFLTVLQGMMAGARDHFRCSFPRPLPVAIRYSQQECSGNILNLSMNGACVEIPSSYLLPRVKGAVTMTFSLPDQTETISVAGEVSWALKSPADDKKGHTAGVRFTVKDNNARNALWYYISMSAQQSDKHGNL